MVRGKVNVKGEKAGKRVKARVGPQTRSSTAGLQTSDGPVSIKKQREKNKQSKENNRTGMNELLAESLKKKKEMWAPMCYVKQSRQQQ